MQLDTQGWQAEWCTSEQRFFLSYVILLELSTVSLVSLQQQDLDTLLAKASSAFLSVYSDLFHIFLNNHYPDFTCVAYWIGSLSSNRAHPKRIKSLPTTPRHLWLHGMMDSFQRGDYRREETHLFSLTFSLLAWTSSIFCTDTQILLLQMQCKHKARQRNEAVISLQYDLPHSVHRSLDLTKFPLKSILGVSSAWVAIWALCRLQSENHKLKFGKLPSRILWLCEKRENNYNNNKNKSLMAIKN